MFLERDEMKFAILYTLKQNIEPMNMADLCEILTWEKEVMGYFDLAVMLHELIEDGYVIKKFYRDEEAFTLSQKGIDTNEFFFTRVPASIRGKIDAAVHQMKYDSQVDPNAVITDVIPVAHGRYMAALQILDAGSPLLELRIDLGSRGNAARGAGQMKKKAEVIYQSVLQLLDGGGENEYNDSNDDAKLMKSDEG